MKTELHFDDGTTSILEVDETALIEQMNRPKNKRLYVCGVEFSYVDKAEVLE